MIDLLDIEVEIANIRGAHLVVPCKICVWVEKVCRNRRKKF